MTSPYYPQSNGKLERCNRTIKQYLETNYLSDYDEAVRLIAAFVEYYNNERLNSAIGYVPPRVKLEGREQEIFTKRDAGLQLAADRRRASRTGQCEGSQSEALHPNLAATG
jgi:putative transposase